MMPEIVDWGYYSSLRNKISESEFERAEALAENEVRLVVGRYRWLMLDKDAFYFDQLKECICSVMDYMYDRRKSGSGRNITSVSNNGYTESYAIQTESQAKAELQNNIRAWLSGTGLAGAY